MGNTSLHSKSKKLKLQKQGSLSANPLFAWFDRFIIVVGLLNAVATIPQVLEIWIGKDATGVSRISWSYYTFYTAMFLIYGIIHKQVPIIISYLASLVLFILIVIGATLYS